MDLSGRKFTAVLKILREELFVFADDIAGEANIDKRLVAHVRSLAEKIPKKAPRQIELFKLGHASIVLAAYAKTEHATPTLSMKNSSDSTFDEFANSSG
jgi:hypothetical protein